MSKTITKWTYSLAVLQFDKTNITIGTKSFLDQQLGQALQGLQDAQGALDAKVQDVTLFIERTGEPPQTIEEEDSQNTVMSALEKDLSSYQIRVMEAIQLFEKTYRLDLTPPPLNQALLQLQPQPQVQHSNM